MDTNREELDVAFARASLQQRADSLLAELTKLKRRPGEGEIHDARVQSRRMRAALEAFKDLCQPHPWEAAYDSVRAITRMLGKVREAEVMLLLVSDLDPADEPAVTLCREYLQELLSGEVRKRKKALKVKLRGLDTKRLCSQLRFLLSGLGPFEPEAGVPERGRRVLAALADPILSFRTRYNFRRASDRRLHELRIATKKLRYAMEIFDERFPGGLQAQIGHARALQDAAGLHQDTAVLLERLRREIRRLTRQRTTQLALQTGRLLAIAQDRKAELRKSIPPALMQLQASVREALEIPGQAGFAGVQAEGDPR